MNYNYRNLLYKKYFSKRVDEKEDIPANYNKRGYYEEYFLKKFLPIDRNISLLDIGCGEGSILLSLSNLGYDNITGVDISYEAITLLKQAKFAKSVVQSDILEFLQKSIDENKKWHFVLAIDILEHLFAKTSYLS
jgi:2-polyprenyl-3-methyl-5-hydroxy-6-metoxy-1,4-benzoquinol methylase